MVIESKFSVSKSDDAKWSNQYWTTAIQSWSELSGTDNTRTRISYAAGNSAYTTAYDESNNATTTTKTYLHKTENNNEKNYDSACYQTGKAIKTYWNDNRAAFESENYWKSKSSRLSGMSWTGRPNGYRSKLLRSVELWPLASQKWKLEIEKDLTNKRFGLSRHEGSEFKKSHVYEMGFAWNLGKISSIKISRCWSDFKLLSKSGWGCNGTMVFYFFDTTKISILQNSNM